MKKIFLILAMIFISFNLYAGNDVAYVRSTLGSPWGLNYNETMLTQATGAGWQDLRYETVNINSLCSSTIKFIYMDGGSFNDFPLNTFLNNNHIQLENWVSNGGTLFINAATWNTNINCWFGGTSLIIGFSAYGYAVNNNNPIFQGPNLPVVAPQYFGNWFDHNYITGTGFTGIMKDNNNRTILAEKVWGNGKLIVGGLTLSWFNNSYWSPQPNVQNLGKNIFAYCNLRRPILETTPISNISYKSATSGGVISDDNDKLITAKGLVWNKTGNPTLASNLGATDEGGNSDMFQSNISGLFPNTTYYVRAYATNSNGTGYGNEVTFTTDAVPNPDQTSMSLNVNFGSFTWFDNNSNNSDAAAPSAFDSPAQDEQDDEFNNNNSLVFDGSDYLTVPFNNGYGRINNNSPKSLFTYFKTGDNILTRQVLLEAGGSNSGFNIYIYNGKLFVGVWNTTQRRFFSRNITPNTIYLVSMEFNGNKVRTSLNGDVSSSMTFSGFTLNQNGNGIGASNNGTRFSDATSGNGVSYKFGGKISEILCYNTCDQDIRAMIIDFIDIKYNTSYAEVYTYYFGKGSNAQNWELFESDHNFNSELSETNISYSVEKERLNVNYDSKAEEIISIGLYDLEGQLIRTIANEYFSIREYNFNVELTNISSGVYILKAQAADRVESKTVILVK